MARTRLADRANAAEAKNMTNPENKAGRHKAIRSTGRSRARSLRASSRGRRQRRIGTADEGHLRRARLARVPRTSQEDRKGRVDHQPDKRNSRSRPQRLGDGLRGGTATLGTPSRVEEKTAVRKFLTAQTPLTSANPDAELTEEDWGGCSEDIFTDLCDDSTR